MNPKIYNFIKNDCDNMTYLSLKKQIEEDIKRAVLSKNKIELVTLRAIKALILLDQTEKGKTGDLDKAAEIKLLVKAAKQRKESAEIFKAENRMELYEKEKTEWEIINRYLPAPLSREEVTAELTDIMKQLNATTPRDIGKVMRVATSKMAGKADGKMISEIVKQLLVS